MTSSQALSRRTLLKGALAATVVAFNPACRSWTTRPEPGTVNLPPLDGKLLMDEATRTKAANDWGHIIHRTPWAVLVPGSAEDIVKLVRFAREQRLQVAAARGIGQSHSYYGQSQVEAGVVIDMSMLSQIHEIDEQSAWVDAGVRWVDLVKATTPLGKSPPTLTDYLGLSIGGTLSVGGIGGQTFRWGLQVDNVLELDVVTGSGELVRCSPAQQRELFDAVLGGLGQCGIIVRARIRLVQVPPNAREYLVMYKSLGPFLEDQKRLVQDGRFDFVEGFVEGFDEGSTSPVAFVLQLVKYFAPGSEPDETKLLEGLSYDQKLGTKSHSYLEFANRLEGNFDGQLQLPHPWLDMFVPEQAAAAFVEKVLAQTSKAEIGWGTEGRGVILLYAFRPSKINARVARVPGGETAFLFSLLRTGTAGADGNAKPLVAKNGAIYQQLTAVGGKRYGAGSIPMSRDDWREHFQPSWEFFQQAKRQYDPDNILTPGQGIF
jgi:cytokinin dehydrogenase